MTVELTGFADHLVVQERNTKTTLRLLSLSSWKDRVIIYEDRNDRLKNKFCRERYMGRLEVQFWTLCDMPSRYPSRNIE